MNFKKVCFAVSMTTVFVFAGFSLLNVRRFITAEASNSRVLTISNISWKNTYFCYGTTTNGNKITFERKAQYSGAYNVFCNYTKIHYITAIKATFSTTSQVKVGWNNATQTSSYTDIPQHGLSENIYYDYQTIQSGKKFTFTYNRVFYFTLIDMSECKELGVSSLTIYYDC